MRGRRAGWRLPMAMALTGLVAAPRSSAQGVSPARSRGCDGNTITTITIHSSPAPVRALAPTWGGLADVVGLHFTVTKPRVIRAYLLLTEGGPCTERDRSESERLLRLQPYISSASVRAVPDGPGRVRILVETVDEVPVIFGARVRGVAPVRLTLGSQNVVGSGITVALSAERGFAYRNGFGLQLAQFGAFGRPYTLAANAQRYPVGGEWSLEFAHPFFTASQRSAFHTGVQEMRAFYPVVVPVGKALAVSVRRSTYDVGAVTRVGNGRLVGVVGAALIGENVRTASGPVIISDTGLVTVAADTALGGRFPAFRVTRLAAVGGMRALTFETVTGFDALTAAQDMGTGVQVGALAGPSMFSSTLKSDVFLSGDVYAGTGNPRSFLLARLTAEGRSDRSTHRWDGVVGDGRAAWYAKLPDSTMQLVTLEVSAIQHLAYPFQLTFQDHDGGVRGYPNATFAGGRRAVLRLDERRLLPSVTRRADVAIGAFVDAGKLWAGDVPYGVTTGMKTSVGVSVLSAIPSGGKHTYRLDIAFPLNRPRGGARWEVLFSSADRTQMLWREPADIARVRAGAAPSSLLNWSAR